MLDDSTRSRQRIKLGKKMQLDILVGGLEYVFSMFAYNILGIAIPTDEVIFFRGVGIPPTS